MKKFEQYEEKLESFGFTTCEECRDYAVAIQEELIDACTNWEELLEMLRDVFQVSVDIIDHYDHQKIDEETLDSFDDCEPFKFEVNRRCNWALIIRTT